MIVSSSPYTATMEHIERRVSNGAGAVVQESIFEGQIYREAASLDRMEGYGDAGEYLERYLGDTYKGEFLELNIFLLPTDRHADAVQLEQGYAEIVRKEAGAVKVPVSVKLPMRLTNVLSVCGALLARVLFNRFFEPDIDIEKMSFVSGDPFSEAGELRNVLRSTALCAHVLPQLDITVSTGVHDGEAAVKALLCGASAVQVCSAIHKSGYKVIGEISRFIDDWAARHGVDSLEAFRGRMDYGSAEGDHYQRVQYMKYFPHGVE